jgi:hypothetical protein
MKRGGFVGYAFPSTFTLDRESIAELWGRMGVVRVDAGEKKVFYGSRKKIK